MKSIKQTTFWQTPFTIKMIALWFFVLGINEVSKLMALCVGGKCEIEIFSVLGSILSVFIYLWIAVGLVNKNKTSREWATFFVSLGLLGILFILAIVVFENPSSTNGIQISYKLSRQQTIIALIVALILHVGMLFVLLRSATKAFFTLRTTVEDNQ